MFHTSIEPRAGMSPSVHHLMAFVGTPLPSPADMALCREKVRAARDCVALRFAAEAQKSSSRHAFRTAFTTADWRMFSSFCVATRLPSGFRVLMPGSADRTLRFVVEGSLSQECKAARATSQPTLLLPGTILGEDTIFSNEPSELEVRAAEDSLILELSLPRRRELTAACPAIAFELLRAAGGVIAARGRPCAKRDQATAN